MPFHLSKAIGSHRIEHTSQLLCPNDLSAVVQAITQRPEFKCNLRWTWDHLARKISPYLQTLEIIKAPQTNQTRLLSGPWFFFSSLLCAHAIYQKAPFLTETDPEWSFLLIT